MITRASTWIWRHQVVLAVLLAIVLAASLSWCDSEGYGPWRHY